MFRYKKLGYVALNVTDIDKSNEFYEKLVGLQPVSRSENGPSFFRCSRDHHNIVLYPSAEPGLKRAGFEVEDPEQLEIAFEHFSKAGLNPREVDNEELKTLCQGKSFRILEPNTGVVFEYYSDMMQMAKGYEAKLTKIAYLGHVVVYVNEFASTLKFFQEVLNFRVSDFLGENAWMRCFPHPDHHSFALIKGQQTKLHHVNFMVTDIDDIGRARNRMQDNDVPIVFGPGRHVPSNSIFFYFLEPDGMTLEYSFGMEQFPENDARKPRMLQPGPDTIDTWGGKPDPKFASVGKIDNGLHTVK